jgi:transposase-like protein
MVVKGDGCWAIANTYKIELNDFYKWNPAVGSTCAQLRPDNYVCVGV